MGLVRPCIIGANKVNINSISYHFDISIHHLVVICRPRKIKYIALRVIFQVGIKRF